MEPVSNADKYPDLTDAYTTLSENWRDTIEENRKLREELKEHRQFYKSAMQDQAKEYITSFQSIQQERDKIQQDLIKVETGNIRLWKQNELYKNALKKIGAKCEPPASAIANDALFVWECDIEVGEEWTEAELQQIKGLGLPIKKTQRELELEQQVNTLSETVKRVHKIASETISAKHQSSRLLNWELVEKVTDKALQSIKESTKEEQTKVNTIPDKGHGPIILDQIEDGSWQLRDNLSRMWCACGQPAVEYYHSELPQYQFKCAKHAQEVGLEQTP